MINLCRSCCDKRRLEQGEAKVNGVAWKEMIKRKAFRGKLLAAFGVDDLLRKMWERIQSPESVGHNAVGGSNKELLYKEELELLRNVDDLRLHSSLMR